MKDGILDCYSSWWRGLGVEKTFQMMFLSRNLCYLWKIQTVDGCRLNTRPNFFHHLEEIFFHKHSDIDNITMILGVLELLNNFWLFLAFNDHFWPFMPIFSLFQPIRSTFFVSMFKVSVSSTVEIQERLINAHIVKY